MRRVFAALLTSALAAPAAGAPLFQLPVACNLGEDCYIQQYMDHDPSGASHDYLCQPLSYDTHSGTDFALRTTAAAKQGVAVLAAADGTVLGVRDGVADVWSGQIDADSIAGRDCGNGLVIDHGDGWHTQYCHFKQGSLAVQKGQVVTAGAKLGEIGMSGRTQFPHLHLSVRQDGKPVDPFAPEGANCASPPASDLWADAPAYQGGGLLDMGFSDRVPEFSDVVAGTAAQDLKRLSPAIIAYSLVYGGRLGDVLRMRLIGPGDFRVQAEYVLPKNRARFFRAIGKKRRSSPWPGGTYIATTVLTRDGLEVSRSTTSFDIPR